jgi:putative ATP-binding cassette transporter
MVPGTLREQLLYPRGSESADDSQISDVLKKVNLSDLLDRVDGDLGRTEDWKNILSLGEQQRISFARIFLNKPLIAFLDEATSALDEANEQMLYEQLLEMGISYISVGHRTSLKQFHDFLIVLDKQGDFQISKLEKGAPETPTPLPPADQPPSL